MQTPKESELLSKEIKLLIIGAVLGALTSGIITYTITWKLSHDEKEAELQNIAQALYYDISSIEDFFNYSLNNSASKSNYVHVIDAHYYDDNGLYYVFCKDISGFDSETSQDLYDFYSFVLGIENEQEDLLAITQKRLNEGNVTDYEFIHAHNIMRTLRAAMPDGIKRANKVKKELRQKYHVNTTMPPTVISYYPPQTHILQGGSVELTT